MRLTVRRIYRDTWAHKRPPPLPDDNRRTFRETLALPITKKPAQAGLGVGPNYPHTPPPGVGFVGPRGRLASGAARLGLDGQRAVV